MAVNVSKGVGLLQDMAEWIHLNLQNLFDENDHNRAEVERLNELLRQESGDHQKTRAMLADACDVLHDEQIKLKSAGQDALRWRALIDEMSWTPTYRHDMVKIALGSSADRVWYHVTNATEYSLADVMDEKIKRTGMKL